MRLVLVLRATLLGSTNFPFSAILCLYFARVGLYAAPPQERTIAFVEPAGQGYFVTLEPRADHFAIRFRVHAKGLQSQECFASAECGDVATNGSSVVNSIFFAPPNDDQMYDLCLRIPKAHNEIVTELTVGIGGKYQYRPPPVEGLSWRLIDRGREEYKVSQPMPYRVTFGKEITERESRQNGVMVERVKPVYESKLFQPTKRLTIGIDTSHNAELNPYSIRAVQATPAIEK